MEAERSAAQAGVPPYGGRGDARTSPHGWGSGGGESPLFARSKEKTDNSNRKRKRETLQIMKKKWEQEQREQRQKMTPLQLYAAKNRYMDELFPEVSAYDFYSDIFPPEQCERKGDPDSRGSNPIVSYMISDPSSREVVKPWKKDQKDKKDKKGSSSVECPTASGDKAPARGKMEVRDEGDEEAAVSGSLPDPRKKRSVLFQNEILFRDTFREGIERVQGATFALCSMCSYSGRRKTAKNAYKCHGFCIDLDGVGMQELDDFWGWVQELEKIPYPTYVANSGHGLHIYYVFENPVPLYPAVASQLQRLKRGLTGWVWNRETSNYPLSQRQYQGIFQSFRMIGSCTKLGKGKAARRVKAWKTGKRVTIDYLNGFVEDKYKCPSDPDYSSWEWADGEHKTLEECRKLYPEWYQKRIVEGVAPGLYTCTRGLYDWWLSKIQQGARDGTRYHCISCLYIYAIKCDIDKKYVDADAEDLLPVFDAMTKRPDNAFTLDDIISASHYYNSKYGKITRKEIERRSGIPIPPRKRRKKTLGRKNGQAFAAARALQDIMDPDGSWRNKNGAPTKKDVVRSWRAAHPDGRKADCIHDTGLSKPTVYKWWNND